MNMIAASDLDLNSLVRVITVVPGSIAQFFFDKLLTGLFTKSHFLS